MTNELAYIACIALHTYMRTFKVYRETHHIYTYLMYVEEKYREMAKEASGGKATLSLSLAN